MYGLDLFSGIGGLTKALEGYVQPIAYCENDRYAQCVLLSRMAKAELPRAPIWDDIRTLRAGMLSGFADVIYGGFPCQDISVAGRGAGLEGERSGLFFEIIRLIKEINPSFVFLENVPAIRRRGMGRVLEELTALRYDCRWGMLSASDVGANHKRERWFLLAHSQGKQDRWLQQYKLQPDLGTGSELADTASTVSTRLPSGAEKKYPKSGKPSEVANAERNGLEESRDNGISGRSADPIANAGWWGIEPSVGRVANGVSKRVDRLRGLGNAVVPVQAREAFERLMGIQTS